MSMPEVKKKVDTGPLLKRMLYIYYSMQFNKN